MSHKTNYSPAKQKALNDFAKSLTPKEKAKSEFFNPINMKTKRTLKELESFKQSVKEHLEATAERFGITNTREGKPSTEGPYNFFLLEQPKVRPYVFVFYIPTTIDRNDCDALFTTLETIFLERLNSLHDLHEAELREQRRIRVENTIHDLTQRYNHFEM